MPVERGQVYWCDFGRHEDSRQSGVRPYVVVQTDRLNRVPTYSMTIVVPLSTKGSGRIPSNVPVAANEQNGLAADSFAKCEQIQTVPQDWLRDFAGQLSEEDLRRLAIAIRRTLDV